MNEKRFVILSNKVNNYGYRVDTAGMDLTQYMRNPILLFMHQRAYKGDDDGMPIGTMKDLRLEPNGDITGVPIFTDATEMAKTVARMVGDGTYKMLSAGFEPLATSEAEEDLMPNQRYATITKSKLVEVSVVDIGGDDNAMCLHYAGKTIMLNGYNESETNIPKLNQYNPLSMKEQLIPLLLLVGLPKESNMEQLMAKINDLKSNSENLQSQLAQKEGTIVTLEGTIATLQQAAVDAQLDGMLDSAVVNGKILETQKAIYKQIGANDPENLKKLLDTMPVNKSIQSQMGAAETGDNPLLKLSYDDAHKGNKLAEIRSKYPEYYKQIFKAKFGQDPKA